MPGSRTILTHEQLQEHMARLPHWRVAEGKKLARSFSFPDFHGGLQFVNKVGELADRQGHHPDVHLFWGKVDLETWTHDAGGITEQDILLATQIDRLG